MLDITEEHVNKFKEIKNRFLFKTNVPGENNWKSCNDNDIWLHVVTQVMVVGRSAPADKFNNDKELKNKISYKTLSDKKEEKIREIIHETLLKVDSRYASSDINKCKKTNALAFNLEVFKNLENDPTDFLEMLSKFQDPCGDSNKINYIINNFSYLKSKGARDFLMELGLVKDAIALDTRVINILNNVGIKIPEKSINNPRLYNQAERDILNKICKPLGLSGIEFDRMLYQNYDEIMSALIIS